MDKAQMIIYELDPNVHKCPYRNMYFTYDNYIPRCKRKSGYHAGCCFMNKCKLKLLHVLGRWDNG